MTSPTRKIPKIPRHMSHALLASMASSQPWSQAAPRTPKQAALSSAKRKISRYRYIVPSPGRSFEMRAGHRFARFHACPPRGPEL